MKKIRVYQVDAFTDSLFSGNPAAVCLLDEWLSDALMQSIAAENNLAETAFIVPKDADFEIRWFTPAVEVDLCGHATLASAFVLFTCLHFTEPEIKFHSRNSGTLSVIKQNNRLFLDFPADQLQARNEIQLLEDCIGIRPVGIYKGRFDYMAIVDAEASVLNLRPDIQKIARLDARGLIVTARGIKVDFVSRFFAPKCGIEEDPVTGSAHTTLIPYWSKVLGKKDMIARQLSARGGTLFCSYRGDRCLIGGKAVLFMTGVIMLA